MILIPEIETVLILVPRTGSGSLKRAVLERYPQATLIYRHMEANGVPYGYDWWKKVGIIRDPVERLWSLYKFCRLEKPYTKFSRYAQRQKEAASIPFNEWIVENETVFTAAHDAEGMRYWPEFSVLHSLPENRKSQFLYLRPDLGTHIYRFDQYAELCKSLDVRCDQIHNETEPSMPPPLKAPAVDHMSRFFEWDFEYLKEARKI